MTDATRFGISTSSVDGGIAPDVLARAVEERGFGWLLFDDEPEFSGAYVRFGPVVARPRPTAPIPILVGGASDAALARTVRSGDGWLPFAEFSSPADIARAEKWFGDQGRTDLTITVTGVPADASVASAYLEAGADHVLFNLDAGPEDDALRALNAVTKTVRSVADSHR